MFSAVAAAKKFTKNSAAPPDLDRDQVPNAHLAHPWRLAPGVCPTGTAHFGIPYVGTAYIIYTYYSWNGWPPPVVWFNYKQEATKQRLLPSGSRLCNLLVMRSLQRAAAISGLAPPPHLPWVVQIAWKTKRSLHAKEEEMNCQRCHANMAAAVVGHIRREFPGTRCKEVYPKFPYRF